MPFQLATQHRPCFVFPAPFPKLFYLSVTRSPPMKCFIHNAARDWLNVLKPIRSLIMASTPYRHSSTHALESWQGPSCFSSSYFASWQAGRARGIFRAGAHIPLQASSPPRDAAPYRGSGRSTCFRPYRAARVKAHHALLPLGSPAPYLDRPSRIRPIRSRGSVLLAGSPPTTR